MSPRERIEEAHGLWELAAIVVTHSAYLLASAPPDNEIMARILMEDLRACAFKERTAYEHWQTVSAAATLEAERAS